MTITGDLRMGAIFALLAILLAGGCWAAKTGFSANGTPSGVVEEFDVEHPGGCGSSCA